MVGLTLVVVDVRVSWPRHLSYKGKKLLNRSKSIFTSNYGYLFELNNHVSVCA